MQEFDLGWTPAGKETLIYDEATDSMHVRVEADYSNVAHILKSNRDLRNDGTNGWSASRDMQHVARIPLFVAQKWLAEEGIDYSNPEDWPRVVAKLNDPEYCLLRTNSGRI